MHQPKSSSALTLGVALGLALPAAAQDVVFSIDWHGPTIGVPDGTGGIPITEGDLLTPTTPGGVPALGPLPVPSILTTHGLGGLGLLPGCIGHPAGTPCVVEVDALSYGQDCLFTPNGVVPGQLWWSTDEYALGMPGPLAPNLFTEGPVGDSSADVWIGMFPMPPGPLPPFAGPPGWVGAIDGDGLPSLSGFAYPGTGLIEPDPPVFGPLHLGDNLDALTFGNAAGGGVVYFSLDTLLLDPLTGIPNSGSAAAHGFSSADVLVNIAGGPIVFAPAALLGLDLLGIPDDLDALLLCENGSTVFEPSVQPYDWLGGGTDMLLFSVRRGSPVIGAPDSIFGIPISEGDILTTPLPTALGGISPFPGIFIAAENLGLGTIRTGTAGGGLGANVDDDLDALGQRSFTMLDCDGDGVEDALAIALGLAADANMNGIPDSCESAPLVVTPFCFCAVGAPCGNVDPTAGCRNSTGVGGLLTASGSTSFGADDLVLSASQLPPFAFGLTFMAPNLVGPFAMGDGRRCIGNGIRRYAVTMANGAGVATLGPGIIGMSTTLFPPPGWITLGSTWHFQHWYRDPAGPCGTNYNVTHAVSATFVP